MQEVTFHPHINQHSLVIMQERRGGNGSASFLNRLEADLHGRKMRLQVGTTKHPLSCSQRAASRLHKFRVCLQNTPGVCAVQRYCIRGV